MTLFNFLTTLNVLLSLIIIYLIYNKIRYTKRTLNKNLFHNYLKKANDIIASDPHHNGIGKWMIKDNKFYHKVSNNTEWIEVKKMSLTPARIIMMYQLIMESQK